MSIKKEKNSPHIQLVFWAQQEDPITDIDITKYYICRQVFFFWASQIMLDMKCSIKLNTYVIMLVCFDLKHANFIF